MKFYTRPEIAARCKALVLRFNKLERIVIEQSHSDIYTIRAMYSAERRYRNLLNILAK